jgi:hypothetical protein
MTVSGQIQRFRIREREIEERGLQPVAKSRRRRRGSPRCHVLLAHGAGRFTRYSDRSECVFGLHDRSVALEATIMKRKSHRKGNRNHEITIYDCLI